MTLQSLDRSWAEVVDFGTKYIGPTDVVLAPTRFKQYFSQVIPYAALQEKNSAFQWAILHKGRLKDVNRSTLNRVIKEFKPVFSNSVFIVFCSHPDAARIPHHDPHLQAFWAAFDATSPDTTVLDTVVRFPRRARAALKSTIFSKTPQFSRYSAKARYLSQLAIQDLRVKVLGQVFPIKPMLLNLMVNDVCNSRCQMCLIWQNKKDKEFTSDELAVVLNDELFSELQYVGVSGGEPTLRKDLPEIFKAICQKQPRVRATGIITNGILHDVVKDRILESAAICKTHGLPFNVMFSLDGLHDVHDEVRGRKNNFESVISLIQFFHEETDIPTSFGCTITATNARYVDELLDYAQEKGLYGRFRIAEFIDRLYNADQGEFIRSFDSKLAYHLGLFFFRVEHEFEHDPLFKKTYRNIRGMIAEGKSRQIGCPYQTKAAVLTARGELLYCSPKSPVLGSALEQSPKQIYWSNINQRKKVIRDDCDRCIHDYHEPITLRDELTALAEVNRRRQYDCSRLLQQASKITKTRTPVKNTSELASKTVLIVGWYGTETVGDKGILWSVVNQLRKRKHPPRQLYLSSLYPFVSRWTIQEMELGDIEIVETYSPEFQQVCDRADEIVVGGGPLMDIEPLNHILYAFMRATKRKAIARIEGCGIGPLTSPLYTKVVSEIVRLADEVTLRDRASTDRCLREFSIPSVVTVPDPATHYVEIYREKIRSSTVLHPPLGTGKNVACFLREWTTEYAGHLSPDEFLSLKDQFEHQLVQFVWSIASTRNADIHLLPMHTFHVGGDDRKFNRSLSRRMNNLVSSEHDHVPNVAVAREPVSPAEILESMYCAEFNICMRFHSVLFAETLGVPYCAIDYTSGGKISAFLKSKGKLDKLISLQDIAKGMWKETIASLVQG